MNNRLPVVFIVFLLVVDGLLLWRNNAMISELAELDTEVMMKTVVPDPTLTPTPAPVFVSRVVDGTYDDGKYSFVIPEGFAITEETEQLVVLVNERDVEFRLWKPVADAVLECVVTTEQFEREISGVTTTWVVLNDSEDAELCATRSKTMWWHVGTLATYPAESGLGEVSDTIWFSYDASKVPAEEAVGILEEILATFEIKDDAIPK